MHVPEHYRERDGAALLESMRANAFATIISAAAGERPAATWIPFLVEGEPARPVLYGHMARENPQWRDWSASTPLLALFQGSHHYVTPAWYETEPNVPTWNYLAVQVLGRPRLLEDPVEVEAMLDRLVAQFESPRPAPWALASQPPGYRSGMARGIVGFELLIDEITGAAKLSQNRSEGDRARVVAGLEAIGGDDATAIARLMRG